MKKNFFKEKDRIIDELKKTTSAAPVRSFVSNIDYKSSPTATTVAQQYGRSLMTELSDPEALASPRLNQTYHYPVSMTLEATEIDYLRRIIYSYMMGTDPVTMAKVIVAVLKFPEDEKHKLIENEKLKNSNWLSKFPPTTS